MSSIGIREAKATLSHLIDQAKHGKITIITEHGRPVAQLTPVSRKQKSKSDWKNQLIAAGLLTESQHSGKTKRWPTPRLLKGIDAQALLQEDRNA